MSHINITWESERTDHKFLAALEDIKLDIMKMCIADIAPYDYVEPDAENKNGIKYLNHIVPGEIIGSPSNVSIAATAMLMCSFGDFPIPPEIMEYITEEYEAGRVNEWKFPKTEEKFELGKALIEAFMEMGSPYYAACAMAGAAWVECGWNVHVYNKTEKGNGGVGHTGGWAGCGEGLFGLTFWSQKEKVIKKLNPPGIPQTKEGYEKSNKHLCDLDEKAWIDILKTYLEICVPKHKEILCTEEEPEDDETRTKILCSGYLFKAGGGMDSSFENAKEMTERYMRTHMAQAKNKETYKVYNGFALQIWTSIMLDKYLHDEEMDLDLQDLSSNDGQATTMGMNQDIAEKSANLHKSISKKTSSNKLVPPSAKKLDEETKIKLKNRRK